MKRWSFKNFFLVCFILLGLFYPFPTVGQVNYPTQPIKILVGYPPGGNVDIGVRILAESASKNFGQPVVVENKPGGNSYLAFVTTMDSKPDGYTLCETGSLKYDCSVMFDKVPRKVEDGSIIACYFSIVHGVAVKADAPWNTFKDLVEYARANPGKVTYSTPNAGGPTHLAMVMVGKKEKINWKVVPYPGLAPCVPAVLGGHVTAIAGLAGVHLEQVRAGKLKLLTITGGARLPDFPDIPTLMDLGYDIAVSHDFGLAGPKGIDPLILGKLRYVFAKVAKEEKFQDFLKSNNIPFTPMDAEKYIQYLKRNLELHSPIIEELGLAYKK